VTSSAASIFVLALIRLLLLVYAAAVLICSIVFSIIANNSNYLFYYTRLSFIGITFYLLAATIHTICYWRQLRKHSDGDEYPEPYTLRSGSVWTRLQFMLYATAAVNAPVVTFIYWTFLYPYSARNPVEWSWISCSQHAVNSLIVVVEIVLGRFLLYLEDLFVCVLALPYLPSHPRSPTDPSAQGPRQEI